MFWIILGVLVAGEAAKLDNTYLPPPPGAKESGGSDGVLQVPLEPPYVDPYSPNSIDPQGWRPGTRAANSKPSQAAGDDDSFLENEDDIAVPAIQKGRFISGSYSYTGPDNVLVTVTYKANDKKSRKEDGDEEKDGVVADENDEEEEEVVGEEEEGRDITEEDSGEEESDSIVPTPPTLPGELARAFDFHNKKQHSQAQEGKTTRPKKPIRKTHKNGPKRTHGHRNGEDSQAGSNRVSGSSGSHQGAQQSSAASAANGGDSGYHYSPASTPQGLYGAPTIHQGYSYPKQS